MLLCFLGMIPLFAITRLAVSLHRAEDNALAKTWNARAMKEVQADQAERAVEDFRTALVYSQGDATDRLPLAQALIAAHRPDEAWVHLQSLWEDQPASGTVNLELARLATLRGDTVKAIQYYHNAIYGVWDQYPEVQRRQARLELIRLLLNRHERDAAQAALIELAGELPQDAALYTQTGSLFMEAEAYSRALEEFRMALHENRHNAAALAGAGEAAFEMGDYVQAHRYFEPAVKLSPQNASAADHLATANLVLSLDPFEHRLSREERSQRVARAFSQATDRLQACAAKQGGNFLTPSPNAGEPMTGLKAVYARALELQPQIRAPSLLRNPDLENSAMDLVFEAETLAAKECGAPAGPDLALLLLARQHRPGEP